MDPLGNMLTSVRNAGRARHKFVCVPDSPFRERVLDVLRDAGYIRGYTVKEIRKGVRELEIELKYYNDVHAIHKITRISKPGRRVYMQIANLPKVNGGLGIYVLSTSLGVMSDIEARKKNVGGEVICCLF